MAKIKDEEKLLLKICDVVHSKKDPLVATVKLLKASVPHYNWVGIYLIEGDRLVLHNYLGKPTQHSNIAVGDGICGAAAAEMKTIIVPDVMRDPRYIACSIETKSEIVVPILTSSGRRVLGEIDIDSDTPDAFDEEDKQFLEKVAAALARSFG